MTLTAPRQPSTLRSRWAWLVVVVAAAAAAAAFAPVANAQEEGFVVPSTCFEGNEYEFYLLGKEFAEASAHAKSLTKCGKKGHLVSIGSAAEELYVEQLLLSSEYSGSTWIGLQGVKRRGKYVWVTGEKATYTNWGEGMPTVPGNNDCVILDPGMGGQWFVEKCGKTNDDIPRVYSFPYIVEFDCAKSTCGGTQVLAPPRPQKVCKAESKRCWMSADCCTGLTCQGNKFKYCKK